MIRLSLHAREAIDLRGLRTEWIEATITMPAVERPDPKRPGVTVSFRPISAFGNRVLRVAHRAEGADILVITAYFDRGARL